MSSCQVLHLGRQPYRQVHQQMQALLTQRINDQIPDTLLLCQHEAVYTVGRRREALQNILDAKSIPVETVERGGDVTFHGPGQLVGYPILKLQKHRRDLHAYLRFLENFWINELQQLGIQAGTDPRNTGVWVENKKMVAIGISCRRWVTWHGFACNHSIDLHIFRHINPCGMPSELVTRLIDHLSQPPSFDQLEAQIATSFPAAWASWNQLAE